MKYFIEGTVLLKVLVIGLILPHFITMSSDIIKSINNYYSIHNNWDLINNLAYFDTEFDSSETSDYIFNYYLENGGLYVDFDFYTSRQRDYLRSVTPEEYWNQQEESVIDYPMIYANANYLEDHMIKDISGDIIDLKSFNKDVLLVPQKYKNKDLNKAMYSQEREIVYIQDSGSYVNLKLSEPLNLTNPVIHLVTQKTSEVMLQHYLFLPIQNKSISDYRSEIKNMNQVDANIKKYNVASSHLKDSETQIKETLLIFVVYIVFMVTLIYQSVYLYIYENQLRISLAYMNGYSQMERYRELSLYIPLTYFFILLLGIFIFHIAIIPLVLFCLLSLFIEILTHYIMIRRFESKNIAAILKGESEL